MSGSSGRSADLFGMNGISATIASPTVHRAVAMIGADLCASLSEPTKDKLD
jgi:hypothetical protein